MSAWVLPDHLADVLPCEARHIEDLRRTLLDAARGYGYELVIPPQLEFLESLLTGTGQALDLQTFKLVDALSGRTMGLRADTTPQVARIDAHLLNRQGVTRLCYCGSVMHTQPAKPHATREPMQFGAEIYGHAGAEADLEIMLLAIDCLKRAGLKQITLDLADARLVRGLLAGLVASPDVLEQVHAALAAKDTAALAELSAQWPSVQREGLLQLVQMYGDEAVLANAPVGRWRSTHFDALLASLRQMADQVRAVHPDVAISFDLADSRGYAYYTGSRFAIYAPGADDAICRGGRYDEVGAVFGRNRPAAGFSLDIKALIAAVPTQSPRLAVRAPWPMASDMLLRVAIASLREVGETVVCTLPGHEGELQEFDCDRELIQVAGQWAVKAL